MKKQYVILLLVALCSLSVGCFPCFAHERSTPYDDYSDVIRQTADMTNDSTIQALLDRHGLKILNLTWEDTGRYKNSSVGPNISDMTIQVQDRNPHSGLYDLTCMPVIRYENFSDKTGDISPDKFYLLVGNERGRGLKKITLREYLGNLRRYLHEPNSWKGFRSSLLAPRDTHVLVSAQACFLPIPKSDKAEFNPVLFNYQSTSESPAVLAILVTREGTSATIIDNKRDGFSAGRTWGQRLFFNQNGERASLTGERLSDFEVSDAKLHHSSGSSTYKEGLNMVLLIQVPLKQKRIDRSVMACESFSMQYKTASLADSYKEKSSVENAVISHGKVEGPYTEIDNLDIERDPAFPIRVTVQFYKATDNGVVTEEDITQIAEQINKVYAQADYVGSLVVGEETNRPTEHDGDKHQPHNWWEMFWQRHYENTGETREETIEMQNDLLGKNPDEDIQWGLVE